MSLQSSSGETSPGGVGGHRGGVTPSFTAAASTRDKLRRTRQLRLVDARQRQIDLETFDIPYQGGEQLLVLGRIKR